MSRVRTEQVVLAVAFFTFLANMKGGGEGDGNSPRREREKGTDPGTIFGVCHLPFSSPTTTLLPQQSRQQLRQQRQQLQFRRRSSATSMTSRSPGNEGRDSTTAAETTNSCVGGRLCVDTHEFVVSAAMVVPRPFLQGLPTDMAAALGRQTPCAVEGQRQQRRQTKRGRDDNSGESTGNRDLKGKKH